MSKQSLVTDEEVLHAIDADSRASRARVEALLVESNRPDLVAEYRANLRELDLGITGARNAWHSLSKAQRAVLIGLGKSGNERLTMRDGGALVYELDGPGAPMRGIRLATVRNLVARGLLDLDGGAFKPEWSVVTSERGRFIREHGQKS